MLLLQGTLLLTSNAWSAFAADAIPDELFMQARQLLERVPEFQERDPLLAIWLEKQQAIVEALCENIQKDAVDDPFLAQSEREDLQYWITRTQAELDFAAHAPDLEQAPEFNVRDFGATADGVTNDLLAFDAAIAAAAKLPASRVLIPAGRYLLKNPGLQSRMRHPMQGVKGFEAMKQEEPQHVNGNLLIQGVKNMLITGEEGTELLFDRPLDTAILVLDCDNVEVRNLDLVHTPKAYSTGQIVAIVNDTQFELQLDPMAEDPTQGYFKEGQFHGMFRTYSEQRLPGSLRPAQSSVSAHNTAPDVEKIGDGRYRFTLHEFTPAGKYYAPGMRIAYYPRTYGNHMVINESSNRTRLHNIRLQSSSAMAFLNNNSDFMFLTDCEVSAAANSWVSTSADGLYYRDTAFGGLTMNNRIENIGDDFINVHSMLYPALKQQGNSLFFAATAFPEKRLRYAKRFGFMPNSVGDLSIAEEYHLIDYQLVTDEQQQQTLLRVDFQETLPEIATVERCDGTQTLPDMFTILENQCCGNVIWKNRFAHGVSRMLLGGRNWLFAENEVEDSLHHTTFFGIGQAGQVPRNGFEGCQPRNILILRNRIHAWQKHIFDFYANASAQPPRRPLVTHLQIKDNDLVLYPGSNLSPFLIRASRDIEITGNRIIFEGQPAPEHCFEIQNSEQVTTDPNWIQSLP